MVQGTCQASGFVAVLFIGHWPLVLFMGHVMNFVLQSLVLALVHCIAYEVGKFRFLASVAASPLLWARLLTCINQLAALWQQFCGSCCSVLWLFMD